MTILILGIIVLIGIHFVPAFPDLRDSLMARLGRNGYRALFSVVSLLGLALVVWGFAKAPVVQIWAPPVWTRHLALLLMLPVFPLLFAAYLPGKIKAKVRHPMLAAIKFWALAHLIANGDLASIILFGSFLAYAVVDRILVKRRGGAELVLAVSEAEARRNDLISLGAGLALYVAFLFWLHPLLIGVSPLASG
ncbi:MAG TPA: NnrU family protein [Methyloceanibacter sp.]|jgi:uncharacterized membrane protein